MSADVLYVVEKFPDRKRWGLYRVTGNVYEPIAYFKSEAAAKLFAREVHPA